MNPKKTFLVLKQALMRLFFKKLTELATPALVMPPSGTISRAYATGLRKTLKDDFDVTFAAANRTSSARVASLTVEHIGPFFDQMRIFHAAAPELVEEPGRLVVLDESPLWSQTEKVISFFSFLVL